MSFEEELVNIKNIARDLAAALRAAKGLSDDSENLEATDLLTVLERWLFSLEEAPDKGEIDDIWYDLKNEVQFFGWGSGNGADFGDLTGRIKDLQDEFYEAMVYLLDSIKEDKEEALRQDMLTRRKRII